MNKLNPKASSYFQRLLIVLCGILLLSIVYELVRPYQFFPAVPSTVQDKQPMTETPQFNADRTALPTETFSEIIERPLFMDTRRPYVAPVSADAKKHKRPHQTEPDILTLISLSAIVITNEKHIALIEDNRTGKLQQLHQGEMYGGWTLTDVGTNSIAMQKGPDTRNIELVVKPSRTPRAKPQSAKPENVGKEAGIASPADVSEASSGTK